LRTAKPVVAISVGDLNGIGFEIAIRAHEKVRKVCEPHYFIDPSMAMQAADKLKLALPADFICTPIDAVTFDIRPGRVDADAGAYSFASFKKGVEAVEHGRCIALVTLPIHKEAWMQAGIRYKGHTDALRDFFDRDAIMMLGCEELYVALFTEHIPLKNVASEIDEKRLVRFLLDFHNGTNADKVGVLGLNPHAGDHGVLGDEESIIESAIAIANESLNEAIFEGPLVPDVAFSPRVRSHYRYLVAMYHDQGLAPLKALYFDESVNISLGLPIVRTSVDHGTAFDIAYLRNRNVNLRSYLNAIKAAIDLAQRP